MSNTIRVLSALLLLGLTATANATTTTVEDFRGTIQSVTSTGIQTISLGSTTTIVRINASSDIYVVGMDGGYDGRIVIIENVGSGDAYFYHEHTSASSAQARFVVDANGSYQTLWNGVGLGLATYDNTTQRWRFVPLLSYNSAGEMQVNGQLTARALVTGNTTVASDYGVDRLTLKSLATDNDGSALRWLDHSGGGLFSMGPDYNGDEGKNWWLYDLYNGVSNFFIDNAASSFLSFGTTAGGMQYDDTTGQLGFFTNGLVRAGTDGYAGASWMWNTTVFYRRVTGVSDAPTLSSNCNGSGSASFVWDYAGDQRGAITLGTGATACTLTFYSPYDITYANTNKGQAICTANSDTSAGVKITAQTDHYVTFTPTTSGAQIIYYHCDGIAPQHADL